VATSGQDQPGQPDHRGDRRGGDDGGAHHRDFCSWFFFHDEARNNRLRRSGQPAEATILEVSETGVTVQGNYPLAKLRLRVEPAGGEPYEVSTKCLMERFQIPAYQPGSRISVLVDPRNRRKVAVM
jgi:hypothetical protein